MTTTEITTYSVGHPENETVESRTATQPDIWAVKGSAMWAELHRWALDGEISNGQQWLDAFTGKIGCGECRQHWFGLLNQYPPDFSSRTALFSWTVFVHNAVNQRLGKPEITLETATARWRSPDMWRSSLKIITGATARVTPENHNHLSGGQQFPGEITPGMLKHSLAPLVDCIHAERAQRTSYVTCKAGLYGGNPHAAICRDCRTREPRPAPVITHERVVGGDQEAPFVQELGRRDTTKSTPQINGNGLRHLQPERLLLRSHLSPGDILMLTATVRDLHRAYPSRFTTAIETPVPELWEHNPLIERDMEVSPDRTIEMHYPLINQSNQRPVHFLQGYTQFLEAQLGLTIPVTEFRGAIYLSEEEKQWQNQVDQQFGFRGPFWIMMAGGKYDFTTKWWAPSYYQEVVDHFAGRIQFVQCGQKGHWHPPLKGTFDLIGQTSIRQLIRLMYHAQGVICPVTFAMHLAAAVPAPIECKRLRPCVVIAGGREPPHWEAYPGHQFLHTIGSLPCCASGGCWKSRCQKVGDGDSKDLYDTCERPVQVSPDLRIPQCMMLVRPKDVISAVERYLSY